MFRPVNTLTAATWILFVWVVAFVRCIVFLFNVDKSESFNGIWLVYTNILLIIIAVQLLAHNHVRCPTLEAFFHVTPHERSKLSSCPELDASRFPDVGREIYHHFHVSKLSVANLQPPRHPPSIPTSPQLHAASIALRDVPSFFSSLLQQAANMFRTAILRSAAAVSRTAMRPVAVRKLAIATPRVSTFVPKAMAWQGVRCYSSAGSLEKAEVYSRIKQLLQGFDKVRLDRFDWSNIWVIGGVHSGAFYSLYQRGNCPVALELS